MFDSTLEIALCCCSNALTVIHPGSLPLLSRLQMRTTLTRPNTEKISDTDSVQGRRAQQCILSRFAAVSIC